MHTTILRGDCLQVLKTMLDSSADSVVTDPPAGIAFMNAEWDKDKGGRDAWIGWMTEVMAETLRVLKPGGHALVWALPRTSHWTAMALENAGFEVRDVVTHLFGSGFPKSRDVSKDIDRQLGAERQVIATVPQGGAKFGLTAELIDNGGFNDPSRSEYEITAPATDEARKWDGWGTALKPSSEHWILCRKPIAESSIAVNVLTHGTGALNIGACRIGTEVLPSQEAGDAVIGTFERQGMVTPERVGRWPANTVLSHAQGCQQVGTRDLEGEPRDAMTESRTDSAAKVMNSASHHQFDYAGETVEIWECIEGCPVRELDEQSGTRKSGKLKAGTVRDGNGYKGGLGGVVARDSYGDEGGASRFFYVAKPSRREKETGLEALQARKVNDGRETAIDNPFQRGETQRLNSHPTVKPIELMRHLCRLITPPGGLVLDPFMGSGTTGIAALLEGFSFFGIEQNPEYCEIARLRMAAVPRPTKQAIAV